MPKHVDTVDTVGYPAQFLAQFL